jgi:iron(III) transport system permease protein
VGELLGWAWNSVAVPAWPPRRHGGGAARGGARGALGAGLDPGLERATYAANALPGIVIALALVFFATRAVTSVYQTLPLLVFAYVVRFLPQALAGTEDALGRVDPQLEQAARGLGASPGRVFARITAPLVAPGLLAGATLVFLSTMKELPVTLLLRPIGYDTLATEVWTATGVSAYAEAALPALLLIALSAPVVYGLQLRRRPARAALVPQE